MPSQKDFVSLALSNSACEMLRVLKDHLHQIQMLLSKSLFNDFWQHLASRLDDYILKEVKTTRFQSGLAFCRGRKYFCLAVINGNNFKNTSKVLQN